MKRKVWVCRPHDTLQQAAQLFWDHDCGCAPVVDGDGRVVGTVTDRDALMGAYTQGKGLGEVPVAKVMSRDVQCCKPDDTLAAAEGLLSANQIRRLPVVDEEMRLVGILSLSDLAQAAVRERRKRKREVSDAEIGETLAAVCEPRHVGTREPAAA